MAGMSTEADSNRGSQGKQRSNRRDISRLCEGVLTGIARIRSRRQSVGQPASFRSKMHQAVHSIQKEAARYGYNADEVEDVEFALVAFLDETILTSGDPAADEWRETTFQQEKYGISNAGEKFFDRLTARMQKPDSSDLADVLEVYLICLLLGFEGRYSGQQGSELRQITADVADRVRRMRGIDRELSPEGDLTVALKAARPSRLNRKIILAACAVVMAGIFVTWVGARLHLGAISESLGRSILETRTSQQPRASLHGGAVRGAQQ